MAQGDELTRQPTNTSSTASNPATGVQFVHNKTVILDLPETGSGTTVTDYILTVVTGTGSVDGPGHLVGQKQDVRFAGSGSIPAVAAAQPSIANDSTGHLHYACALSAYFEGNTGHIGVWAAVTANGVCFNNFGTIDTWVDWLSPDYGTAGTGSVGIRYNLRNDDPLKLLATMGQSVFGGAVPSSAAALVELQSTSSGFMPPRMTTAQKDAIVAPPEGLMVYDLTLHKLCVRTRDAWETIASG